MRFYFICHPQGPSTKAAYQHCSVALAEGLSLLGLPVFGNLNYWEKSPGSGDYLIRKADGVDHNDCDVILFGSTLYDYPRPDLIPSDLFRKDRPYRLIFIDNSDGRITPGFLPVLREADLVLKSHYCGKHSYPENFTPWQFGLTERMIASVEPLPFAERENAVLVNFRIKHHLRTLAEELVMPAVGSVFERNETIDDDDDLKHESELARHFWRMTGGRHYPAFYKRLGRQKACAAFGGYLENTRSGHASSRKMSPARIRRETAPRDFDSIYQFDSWRFWESMLSGCVTLHIDFEAYGATLPVMPLNGGEYLGIDFSKPEEFRDRLHSGNPFESIGLQARDWCLKHYSPVAVAQRLLGMLS